MVKLSSVASKLTTGSAKDMIKAMIAGQRDPRVPASLARTSMKAKREELAEALDGMFDSQLHPLTLPCCGGSICAEGGTNFTILLKARIRFRR